AARGRGGQRHEPARHRGQRLVRRQDNRFLLVGHGDRAQRVLARGHLEGRHQVVERDELLIADHCDRQRATAVFRQQRERRRWRGLAGQRRNEREQKREGGGGELRDSASVQWR